MRPKTVKQVNEIKEAAELKIAHIMSKLERDTECVVQGVSVERPALWKNINTAHIDLYIL